MTHDKKTSAVAYIAAVLPNPNACTGADKKGGY